MKIDYAQAKKMKDVLDGISVLKLTRPLTLAVVRNSKSLAPICQEYEEQRNDIINRYAKKDENGNLVLDKSGEMPMLTFEDGESLTNFALENSELMNVEIDIAIMMVECSELDKCDNLPQYDSLTPSQELSLDWMINYGDKDPE